MTRRKWLAASLVLVALGGCAATAPGAAKSWYTPYSHENYGLRGGGG